MSPTRLSLDEDAPLLRGLERSAASAQLRYCTPGHKGGGGAHRLLRDLVGHKALQLDLGLAGDLDNLQTPRTWIKRAGQALAALYAVRHSYFLVNGTSGGIHAALLGSTSTGDSVVVARNVHRAVAAGIILSGATPVFVSPEFDDDLNIPLNVSAKGIAATVGRSAGARALILTSPSYHGVVPDDLASIVQLAHDHQLPVLVDEAHGSHLRFSPSLPLSAVEAGADLCVHSFHKTVGSLTQSSVLHANGQLIDVARLESTLGLLQTTSPSYLLLASLDIARLQLEESGHALISEVVHLASNLRRQIDQIGPYKCITFCGAGDGPGHDLTKVVIATSGTGLSGYAIARRLNNEHGILAELADEGHLLLFLTIGNTQAQNRRLARALRQISSPGMGVKHQQSNGLARYVFTSLPALGISPREAFLAKRCTTALRQAAGRTSASIVSAYPPGVPVLWPGETIDEGRIEYCAKALAVGARLVGIGSHGCDSEPTIDIVA